MEKRTQSTEQEQLDRIKIGNMLDESPIPEDEKMLNLSLYLRRQEFGHLLFLNEIYQKIINIHGVIMEFGCRWGRNLPVYQNLRGIYEPYNWTRKVIGFDTFAGMCGVGSNDEMEEGEFNVSPYYIAYLHEVMGLHNSNSPIAHVIKHDLIQGDVCTTLPDYMASNKETVIALAYIDLDIYQPVKEVLEVLDEYMLPGSIVAFDELNHPMYPGETKAFFESPFSKYTLHRSKFDSYPSWVQVGE